jgi:hypothetical protein
MGKLWVFHIYVIVCLLAIKHGNGTSTTNGRFSGHFEGPQALILTWFEGCLGLFWSWGLPLSKKFVEPLRWGSQVLYRCMIRLTFHELQWLWM